MVFRSRRTGRSTGRGAKTRGLRLGTVGGDPIILTAGWLVITILMTIFFTPVVEVRLGLAFIPAMFVAMAVPLLLAVSVLAHELAHGIIARINGYQVREYVITLWGGHTSFTTEIDRPGAAAAVAVAGPGANIVLALIGWFIAPVLSPIGAFLAISLALTNGFVAAFNLLPASPLDGGKLLEALIWRVTNNRWLGMRVAGRLGQVTAVAVAAAFIARPYLTNGEGDMFTIILGLIVASVIWQGAHQTVKAAQIRSVTQDFRLDKYLRPVTIIDAEVPVARIKHLPAIVSSWNDQSREDLVGRVPDSGVRLTGVVDAEALAAVPVERRHYTPVSAVQHAARIGVITRDHGSQVITQIAQVLDMGADTVVYLDPSQSDLFAPAPRAHNNDQGLIDGTKIPAAGIVDVPSLLRDIQTP